MRLQTQLTLLLVFVALVPVSVSGVTSVWLSRAALEQTQEERLTAQARQLADLADSDISTALTDLRLGATVLQVQALSTEERMGALALLHRQHDRFNITTLITSEGDGVGDPVFNGASREDAHEVVNTAELEAFSQHIPLTAALRAGAAIGPAFLVDGKAHPLISLAVAVPLGDGKRGILAVELSLAQLLKRVRACADEAHGAAWLVDGSGKVFAGANGSESMLALPTGLDARLLNPVSDAASVRSGISGTESLVGVARLARLPWTAMVAQDVDGALAPARNILAQTGFWIAIALICALLLGTVLARSFSTPIHTLARAAEAFQRGEFSHRTPALKPREMAELGNAFNRMAGEVQRRDDELRSFNTELQKRVDERTRDLKEAQDQLIHSQKMAAVGELGAGVAHEINNPLAGVIGLIQLRLLRAAKDDPTTQVFQDIEKEALRIRDIVQNLLALTPQKGAGEALVDVNKIVESALGLMTRPIVSSRIHVKKELDQELPKMRGRASDLQQSLVAIISNARNAMPDGGTLTVSTRNVDGKLIKIVVEDTGTGIPPEIMDKIFEPFFTTKPTPDSKGLGLAMVHRVVLDHGGRIAVDSEPGRGASFSITLTAAREKTHLV